MPVHIPMVIAHRGASAAHPENTVAAFVGARDAGADGVELDARRTADGHVIVHHDAQLPDGRVIVELAAAELPDHVPSLAEALDACAGMVVNIEIKNWPDDPDFDGTEQVAVAGRRAGRLDRLARRRARVVVPPPDGRPGARARRRRSRPPSSTSASTGPPAWPRRSSTATARSTPGTRS